MSIRGDAMVAHYIEDIFVYIPTILSTFIIFIIINKININVYSFIYITLAISTLTTITIFIQNYNLIISRISFVVLTIISLLSFTKSRSILKIPISIISIGISYCFRMIGVFFTSIVTWIIQYDKLDIYVSILIAIIQVILVIIYTNIKRFKNGISFFNKRENLGTGLILSGFIFIVISISGQNYIDKSTFTILAIGLFISSIGLFLWIRKSITEHYRKKLQAKADEHYQNTIAEKEQQIEQLNNSNAFLSKIVHRDNHIMTSLQHTITKYKDCDNPSEKEKLMNEILTLAQERSDLIVKEQNNTKVLPTTGISLIDGALSNMYIKATAHHIDFNLIINQDIHYLINNLITQTDLETLLCDHIKDAIIAINSGEVIKGKILVTITMNDDIYEISIKDNGVDFEVDTLAKLGLERVTTHKDIGGSGIGFMTTFETLKRSNASIIITEHKTKTPFSKSITFRFDGLNAFIINSYRADLLKQLINRNDIIIM